MKYIITLLFFISFQSQANDQKEAAMSFMKALKGELMSGMKKGPVNALESCNDKAMKITRSFDSDKFRVGRTSLHLRNSKNKPDRLMNKLLNSYKNTTAKNPLPAKELILDNGRRLFVKPLYMKGMCLNCHGDNISKSVSDKLKELYPDDKAIGYKVGQFRGLVWVEDRRK